MIHTIFRGGHPIVQPTSSVYILVSIMTIIDYHKDSNVYHIWYVTMQTLEVGVLLIGGGVPFSGS